MSKKKKLTPRKRVTEEPNVEKLRLRKPSPWSVKLKHQEERIVKAKSEAGAWQAYKKLMGIRHTEHDPKITPCGPNVEYDEETGKLIKASDESAPEPTEEELELDDDDFDDEE